jgi:CHAT domain-containing protein/Tfp pilus assembly protein PilF
MKKSILGVLIVLVELAFSSSGLLAQSEDAGNRLLLEGETIKKNAQSEADIDRAIRKYQAALAIFEKVGSQRGKSSALNNIGLAGYHKGQYDIALDYFARALKIAKHSESEKQQAIVITNVGAVYNSLGQYGRALDYYEQSLGLYRKIADTNGEALDLNNIGVSLSYIGKYTNALAHFEQALAICRRVGLSSQEANSLNNIGRVYRNLGDHEKALKSFEESLKLARKAGNLKQEAITLSSIADVLALEGKHYDAIRVANESLEINKRLGVPTKDTIDLITNYYLDMGDIIKAEPLARQTQVPGTLGRLNLFKSDYPSAMLHYTKDAARAKKTGQVESLFRGLTGLAVSHEKQGDYYQAEEFYGRALKVTEDMRSTLLPSERKNFFEVKIGGFQRSEPAKGLTRVRMKMNNPEASIMPGELTKAREFADHLALTNPSAAAGLPLRILQEEQSLVSQLAALKLQLASLERDLETVDTEKLPEKYFALNKLVKSSNENFGNFVEKISREYPAYAAVKYPKPISLNDSALKPGEYVVVFDVSDQGVAVILCSDKTVRNSFYLEMKKNDLEKYVSNFREPLQKLKFEKFDVNLAKFLYQSLFGNILRDIPKGAPLVIIPDGPLNILPFEALVASGEAKWEKDSFGYSYPAGLNFLEDEHPISYWQSLTALTLSRKFGLATNPGDKMLIIADPVFSMKDARAQASEKTRLTDSERNFNIGLMRAVEEVGQGFFIMERLPLTSVLAENLEKLLGDAILPLTGLRANKIDFMQRIAPSIDSYRDIVFATHGVMSAKIPGLMEPFLALTMIPPGTDGFLKMSDILSLRMNADVVALTACQTGLGKDVSGEGVMSMGRAFQYTGVKSVIMTLWEVEESSATKLTEKFFQHRKNGKSKLEALQAARVDLRAEGYRHPYFWAGFILVGETN